MEAVFKQFVSEKQIEEVKQKRQEEWEKVRRPDQPLVREDDDYDHRSLYERLKSQKDKAEADKAEQFKFKNMIYKGLDDDESKFLHLVAKQQAEQKAQKLQQEKEEILLFQAVERAAADEAAADKTVTSSQNTTVIPRVTPPKSVNSLLKSGLVKIKRKSESGFDATAVAAGAGINKKQRTEEHHDTGANSSVAMATTSNDSKLQTLCVYSDTSSDDET